MKSHCLQGVRATAATLLFALILAGTAAVAVAGDDRWLEQPRGEQALAWAQQQTALSKSRLAALPLYGQVKRELAAAMQASASEPKIVFAGPHAIRLLRNADHPHGLLQVATRDADGVPGIWDTALDIGQLREQEQRPLQLQTFGLDSACLAPEYARCLLRLSPGGGDEVEIREFDLPRRRFVEAGFRTSRSRTFAQWMGPDSVLIQHTIGDAPRTAADWPATAQLWQRGTPLSAAPVVYRAGEGDTLLQLHAAGRGDARRGVIVRTIDYSTFEVHLVDGSGRLEKADLPRSLKPMGVLAITDDHIVVQLAAADEARRLPAETLLAYSLRAEPGQTRTTVIRAPSQGEFIAGRSDIAASGQNLAFAVNRSLSQRLMMATPSPSGGWSVSEILQPQPGETVTVDAGAGSKGDFLFTTSGFLTPGRLELYRPGQPLRRLATDPGRFDASGYTTRIDSAVSRDGTVIDYYVLEPRTPRPGAQPTLMTGYGAFGISIRPGYFDSTVGGPAFKLWLDRGGSLVIPAIRGGGERGAAWHHAAIREHRQRSYDDFIAVAEHLVDSGYTRPEHLGIFGMSNGGLLTATVGIQRPDLFAAVVSDVPLTDLPRMKYMGMGAAWLDEYGDPDDPAMAEALLRYSPLQNVREGVTYPPFLITISTEDNRVGPGHARKLAARLAAVGAPVHFLEDQEGGHGVSDPLRNPGLMALRMTFLIQHLVPAQSETPVALPGKSLLGTELRAPARSAAKQAELLLDLEIALQTMALAPEREDSYLWLGRRYAYLGRYQDAVDVFTRGLERFPDSYRLLRFRGRKFMRLRQFDAGIADYRRAAALAAGQEDVFEPDGIINRRHQFIGSYQSNIHYYLAQAYWAKGRYQDAWLQMTVASSFPLARNPDRLASTVYWQYLALRRMGRDEEALTLARNVPEGLELLENHGYYQAVLFFSGRLSAEGLLARPDANMRFAHAMWLDFEGDRTASLAALERLVRDTPDGYWPAETEYLRMRCAAGSCPS